MLPVLLNLGFLKIYTFGVFLVLAFFWSTFLLWKNIRLTSYKEETVFDGLFISLFGGLFVGRTIYVALHFKDFHFDIMKFLLINGYPGLSLYGLLIGGLISFFIFAHFKKINFLELIDYAVPPLLVALGIGKLGSFFSGTEVGTKTSFVLALKYANFDGARHLTPLYEAILFFIAAYVAHRMLFAVRREKVSRGISIFFFGWVFSLVYFIMDPIKANKVLISGISVDWIVSMALLLTFTLYFLYHLRTQIFSGVSRVTSSIHINGKSKSNIHQKTAEDAGRGVSETSTADTET